MTSINSVSRAISITPTKQAGQLHPQPTTPPATRPSADSTGSANLANELNYMQNRVFGIHPRVHILEPEITPKEARTRGTEMIDFLYPVIKLPGGKEPEAALVLGVIRQESAFDVGAVSGAGRPGS